MNKIKQIDFFCKKCHKSMKMSYAVTGNTDDIVLNGMMMRCHTNKCTRVVTFKKYTEGMIVANADKDGKFYV